MFFAVAVAEMIFWSEESDVAVVAMSSLELHLEIMLTRIEVGFFSCLLWAAYVISRAVECLVLGLTVYDAFLTLFPTSSSLGYVFLSPNWYESDGRLSRHR